MGRGYPRKLLILTLNISRFTVYRHRLAKTLSKLKRRLVLVSRGQTAFLRFKTEKSGLATRD